jgi:serine/threonine protein kinase
MSSRAFPEPTGSTSSHNKPPEPPAAEVFPPSDDTPTIISKKAPAPALPFEGRPAIRGMRLAHFELIEPIGVGGMAAVLRARDTQLDRLVALKILPQEMAADDENIRRFHQEARSAAKLDHENIARVFFCGEDQRLHFIASSSSRARTCGRFSTAAGGCRSTRRCTTCFRSPPGWPTPPAAASSTATSSLPTSSSCPTAGPSWWTWAWRAAWARAATTT